MSTPFEFGFTLDRWLHALQVMLEKIKGQPRLDKLRFIQVMEADLNMMLCIIFGTQINSSRRGPTTFISAPMGIPP